MTGGAMQGLSTTATAQETVVILIEQGRLTLGMEGVVSIQEATGGAHCV